MSNDFISSANFPKITLLYYNIDFFPLNKYINFISGYPLEPFSFFRPYQILSLRKIRSKFFKVGQSILMRKPNKKPSTFQHSEKFHKTLMLVIR